VKPHNFRLHKNQALVVCYPRVLKNNQQEEHKKMFKNTRTVSAIFKDRSSAERAVSELRDKGFDKEISVVAKDGIEGEDAHKEESNSVVMGGDSVMDGAVSGGVLGGLAGLAIGASALVIPGIGPIIAAGPLAGVLSGATTGGLAGGLIDWGIPAQRSRHYEERVKQGDTLVSLRTYEDKIDEASQVLRQFGAQEVETH